MIKSNFPILGIDISNNNSITDLSILSNNDVKYLYLKATEGATFKDKTTPVRVEQAKSLGMKVGYYHFLVSTSSPEDQATSFHNYIKDKPNDLLPMLDVETNFSDLCSYVLRFINKFNELSDLELGIYSYSGFLSHLDSIGSIIRNRKLWIANYTNDISKVTTRFFPEENVCGWQFSESYRIESFYGDANYFNEKTLLDNSVSGDWMIDETGWWFKLSDGSYPKNKWLKIKGSWYYFNEKGYMETNWLYYSGSWFYLGEDGAMKTGWNYIGGKWYYLSDKDEDNAYMLKNQWEKIDEKWYHFDEDGAMQTGWIKDNGKDYLLYSNGQMAHDTIAYGYKFASSGEATKM